MSVTSRSSWTVQYDLRPAKQVERRMLVDAFQRLAQAGFPIRDYQYTGFGSIYFVDFILFHKLLGIRNMLSIEHDQALEKRVRFNCPFDCINIVIDSSTAVIPTLSRDRRHILWLDYDSPVGGVALDDVYLAATQLPAGSILLITVDVEPPVKGSDEPQDSMDYFRRECGSYFGMRTVQDFAKTQIPDTSLKIIINALHDGLSGREAGFFPLFHFLYADGHRMLTAGGMIGSDEDQRRIQGIDKTAAMYLRFDFSSGPYEINVPKVTRKERQVLDSAMPCQRTWQPSDFALSADDIQAYTEIYRFLPAYAELLV